VSSRRLELTFNLSIILMDLEMPVMDGATCACRIRELERNGSIIPIPIIATTTHDRLDQINNAKAAGIDHVVHKPIRISELIPKIEQLITKYREVQLQVHWHRAASGTVISSCSRAHVLRRNLANNNGTCSLISRSISAGDEDNQDGCVPASSTL
jgi:DNA-binding response OmpR family regulator